jgi:predicted N-acetyltransferase YhbS
MNVEAEYRRRRIGAALIERYARDLVAAGVPGVHLYCGAAPRPFYARNAFADVAALEVSPGRWIYTLGRRLGSGAS